MSESDLISTKKGFVGPTFTLTNRLKRLLWQFTWLIFARWTPPALHKWRIFLLRMFGAKVSYQAYVYSDVDVWAPWNLAMEKFATLGRGVECYNIAPVFVGELAVVSQDAFLCTGTHAYREPDFPLYAKPIRIGFRAWICARAFVGPGVIVNDGAVLSATSSAIRELNAWTVYAGNPAVPVKSRPIIKIGSPDEV